MEAAGVGGLAVALQASRGAKETGGGARRVWRCRRRGGGRSRWPTNLSGDRIYSIDPCGSSRDDDNVRNRPY